MAERNVEPLTEGMSWPVGRTRPAADIAAEQTLLGCLLMYPQVQADVFEAVAPADFYRPAHGQLAEVLAAMPSIDPQLVGIECRRRGLPDVALLLPDLLGRATVAEHAVGYAAHVKATARRRRLQELTLRGFQQASNETYEVELATVELAVGIDDLIDSRPRSQSLPPSVEDFLIGEDTYDWVVPRFLERGDRVILTGPEGSAGKSTFLRQVCVCVAAGLHPVTFARIQPCRALVVDCENPRALLRRAFRGLIAQAKLEGTYEPTRLRVLSRPESMDLLNPTDLAWLTERVVAARPDVLVVGPLYRLHSSSLDKEDAARAITVALDGLRAKAGCALLIEAHSGHGFKGDREWRPHGSSLFMRWPEFGFALHPDKGGDGTTTVRHWRGPRDERLWPERLRRGGIGNWPWVECAPEDENPWTRKDIA